MDTQNTDNTASIVREYMRAIGKRSADKRGSAELSRIAKLGLKKRWDKYRIEKRSQKSPTRKRKSEILENTGQNFMNRNPIENNFTENTAESNPVLNPNKI